MGLYLVSDSFYAKIPIDDPEEKLHVFALECVRSDNEPMLEELLEESQSRLRHLGASPSALFGLATYHIMNYNPRGLATLDEAIKAARHDTRYLVEGLYLLEDVGPIDEELEHPLIQKYVERIIRQLPDDKAATDIAKLFAISRLDYSEEQFETAIAFSLQRKRFQ